MGKTVIIGGGAAGMAAAAAAAKNGSQVHIYEKNEKLGKKLFITGKGRCNLTNNGSMEELFQNVVSNPKFLYSSFYGFTNQDIIELMRNAGCPVKVERGNRVFPLSDKSSDVIAAFSRLLASLNVKVHLNQEVRELWLENGVLRGIVLKHGGEKVTADKVIVAAGGVSYPSTGSTGDGYDMARQAGHSITKLYPALTPLMTEGTEPERLQGLSLKNVNAAIYKGKKRLYEGFGEMLFTHFGVSGPLILSASSFVGKELEKGPLRLSIDLKPAITREQLDARLVREFSQMANKQFKNSLSGLFPAKLIPVMIERSGISPEKKVNEITRGERQALTEATKDFSLTVTGLRGFSEAIITQGGVKVKEIDPSTMESKFVKGLYFAGEVLDVDALTGGFNLQIAWSTGTAAGRAAAGI